MSIVTETRTCQVCAKPIGADEMNFEKTYQGKTYYACCPICFSMLQEEPGKHTKSWVDDMMRPKRNH